MLREKWGSIPEGWDQHRHEFTNGESQEERRAWVQHQIEQAQKAGIELLGRETDDACVFSFKNFDHYAAFYVNVYGDPKTDKEMVSSRHFKGEKVDPTWINAAEMYLQQMGIDYQLEIDGNTAHFAFDRFSESAVFRMIADSGRIDQMADTLKHSVGFQDRLRRILGMHDGQEPDGLGLSM